MRTILFAMTFGLGIGVSLLSYGNSGSSLHELSDSQAIAARGSEEGHSNFGPHMVNTCTEGQPCWIPRLTINPADPTDTAWDYNFADVCGTQAMNCGPYVKFLMAICSTPKK